jgi:hypothetical protein
MKEKLNWILAVAILTTLASLATFAAPLAQEVTSAGMYTIQAGMAPKKEINLGNVGPAGDIVSVTATLEEDILLPGARTNFFVTLTRKEGPAISPLTIWIIPLFDTPALNLYPPSNTTGNGRIEELERGESERVHFLIDYGLEGASPAAYSLLCVTQWNENPPFVLPVFSVP